MTQATAEEIKKAYRRAAKEKHPDVVIYAKDEKSNATEAALAAAKDMRTLLAELEKSATRPGLEGELCTAAAVIAEVAAERRDEVLARERAKAAAAEAWQQVCDACLAAWLPSTRVEESSSRQYMFRI